MFCGRPKMLLASCGTTGVLLKNRPGHAKLMSKKLDETCRYFLFEAEAEVGGAEQAELHGDATLVVGAAL